MGISSPQEVYFVTALSEINVIYIINDDRISGRKN